VTEAQAIELISRTFVAGWKAARPDVPFAIENEPGELPSAGAVNFAYLTVVPTTNESLTSGEAGTRLVGRNGWIQVKLWVPAGDRTAGAYALAEVVRRIFELRNLIGPGGGESLDTRASSTQPIGTDGRWFMLLVRTPFTYFETK
jgi:hypothetical protein